MVRFNDFTIIFNHPLTDEQVRDLIQARYNISVPMGYFVIKKIEGESWERVYSIRGPGKYRIFFTRDEDDNIGISGELMIYVRK